MKYSTASDVWSFGCVMYEIWSLGHMPFEELTNAEVHNYKNIIDNYALKHSVPTIAIDMCAGF